MPDKKTESDKLSYPVSPHTLRLPSDKVLDPTSYPAFVTTAYKSSDEQSYYIISKEKMQYYMLFFPGQQHLLLRRNRRRVKKNIKKKRGFESGSKHEPLFADAFILGLRNQVQCNFTQNIEIQWRIIFSCP